MRADQRDELLVRIDERVKALKEIDMPEIKNHLGRLNDSVAKNTAFRNKAMGALKLISILAIPGGGATAGVLKLFGVY